MLSSLALDQNSNMTSITGLSTNKELTLLQRRYRGLQTKLDNKERKLSRIISQERQSEQNKGWIQKSRS